MGAKAWESGTNGYLGVFLGARYARDRGLGFSLEAAPSWNASALFQEDLGPAGMHGNKTKREEYLMLLDIMAREAYLLQGTIYSNRQTMVSYYNRARRGQREQRRQWQTKK